MFGCFSETLEAYKSPLFIEPNIEKLTSSFFWKLFLFGKFSYICWALTTEFLLLSLFIEPNIEKFTSYLFSPCFDFTWLSFAKNYWKLAGFYVFLLTSNSSKTFFFWLTLEVSLLWFEYATDPNISKSGSVSFGWTSECPEPSAGVSDFLVIF